MVPIGARREGKENQETTVRPTDQRKNEHVKRRTELDRKRNEQMNTKEKPLPKTP